MKILKEGTIKFTKPSEFNDPFDCDPEHDTENLEEFLKSQPDLVEKVLKYRNTNSQENLKEFEAMKCRLKAAIENGHFGQEASDAVGICSLTRDPLNLLMWAHYACNHTGFVVEFDIPLESFNLPSDDVTYFEWLIPQPVTYQKKKPIISFSDDIDVKMAKQFLIKGVDWKYEQEERVIDFVRKDGIHKYDRDTILKSVIAGMRIKPEHYDELKKIVTDLKNQKLNVDLFKAKSVKGEYGVFVEGRPDLEIKNPNKTLQADPES